MKTKLLAAKAPLPKLCSDEAAAEYFETHSAAQVWNQLPGGKPAKLSKAFANSIRERHTAGVDSQRDSTRFDRRESLPSWVD
jgi:hypothetical protein